LLPQNNRQRSRSRRVQQTFQGPLESRRGDVEASSDETGVADQCGQHDLGDLGARLIVRRGVGLACVADAGGEMAAQGGVRSMPTCAPVQPGGPPIWVGGASEAAMRRVGRSGVGWLAFEGLPDAVADHLWSVARHAAEAAGRDPDALKTAMRINLEPGTSVDSVADKLARLAKSGTDEAVRGNESARSASGGLLAGRVMVLGGGLERALCW
jgi:Luciferase-like monooxygenase